MKVSRVVFDTNVLISALLSQRGTARQALDFIRRDGCLVFSDPTFNTAECHLNGDEWIMPFVGHRL
jgi:predicted nucleic acid-binding protein